MNLKEYIEKEISENNIEPVFKVSDLLKHNKPNTSRYYIGGQDYERTTIITNLNNLSIGPEERQGNHVKMGKTPCFVKHRDGRFSIFKKNGEFKGLSKRVRKVSKSDNSSQSKKEHQPKITTQKIAQEFVEYLRNKPFRILGGLSGRARKEWYPKEGAVCGWKERLFCYKWKDSNWRITLKQFTKWQKVLEQIKLHFYNNKEIDCKSIIDVFQEIKEWGIEGTSKRKIKKNTKSNILAIKNLKSLWSASQITEVNSSLTKLYAVACPDEFVIYDSRVAAAIVSIAEDIYRISYSKKTSICKAKTIFRHVFPNLGPFKTASRGGTRPRGVRDSAEWKCAYKNIDAQIEANELCKAIRDELNKNKEDNKSDWTLREVEAVLFMEGY
jgi:hypothetical protein